MKNMWQWLIENNNGNHFGTGNIIIHYRDCVAFIVLIEHQDRDTYLYDYHIYVYMYVRNMFQKEYTCNGTLIGRILR